MPRLTYQFQQLGFNYPVNTLMINLTSLSSLALQAEPRFTQWAEIQQP